MSTSVPDTAPGQSYGKVAKFLHWLLTLNIGATLIFSPGIAGLTDAQKEIEYGNHALSVTTIFLLMLIRTVWRLFNPPPPFPDSMPSNQQRYAHLLHISLYILIFIQIGVGVLLASTTTVIFATEQYGINYTSWALIGADNHNWLLLLHDLGAITIGSFVIVHILAALKHHFIDKDNVLKRMLPFTNGNPPERKS